MTPQQAVQVLDAALAQVSASRATHSTLVEALKVLAALVPHETIQKTP